MTYDDALTVWVMPLVAVVELKRHGVACTVDWSNRCVWVRDEGVRNGREFFEWQSWNFSGHGKIHGSRVLRFLGY